MLFRTVRRSPTMGSKIVVGVVAFAMALSMTAAVSPQGEASAPQHRVTVTSGPGYWLVTSGGVVSAYGGAVARGSMRRLTDGPVVGMAATPGSGGYWLVTSEGAVLAFGHAKSYGSMAGKHLANPVVGMAATPDGRGYWLVASGGGVFSFGNARYYGSAGAEHLRSRVVGMAAAPDGKGYWLVGSDGAVFSFGHLGFYGSASSARLGSPVAAVEATPDGKGYWLATVTGKVLAFGDATSYGSAPSRVLSPIVGMSATADGGGYWLAARNGSVLNFGNALAFKPRSVPRASRELVRAIAASNVEGYAAATASRVGTTARTGGSVSAPATSSASTSGSDTFFPVSPGLVTTPPETPTTPVTSAQAVTATSIAGEGTTASSALAPETTVGSPVGTTALSTSTTAETSAATALSIPTTGTTSQLPTTTITSTATTLAVAGENYEVCTGTDAQQYLTSPWTYDALASGSASYTVAQYNALVDPATGQIAAGATLPRLPSYLADQPSGTDVATIYAPGQNINLGSYNHPSNPELFFFEGGNYGTFSTQALSGDEYIGGSAPSYPEPVFNGGDATGSSQGVQDGQDHYGFSGAGDSLASSAPSGATVITVTTAPVPYLAHVAFADASGLQVYTVSSVSGDTITIPSPGLTNGESSGAILWEDQQGGTPHPGLLGAVTTAASAGATSISTGALAFPVVPGEELSIGSSDGQADPYYVSAVSGSQTSGYSLTLATPLGWALPLNAPVYYDGLAGGLTVEYLSFNQFAPVTTGVIGVGSDNTIEHNLIENGINSGTADAGTAIRDGGSNGTGDVPGSVIEYNCIKNMGNGGMFEFGNGSTFAYNEVTNVGIYSGTVGGAGEKWWGTENSTILDNAFVDNFSSPIWFDDGNTGYLVKGNYFYGCADRCIDDETSFNGDITGNLFTDSGWDSKGGTCNGGQCEGVVNLDDSGAWPIPGSNYENPGTGCPSGQTQGCLLVQGNTFDNDWEGVTIWGEGNRSCLISGELQGTAPYNDSPYCSGGYPNGDGDFTSYNYPSNAGPNGAFRSLQQAAPAGSTTLYMTSAPAVNDQIGFSGPGTSGYPSDSTTDTTDVSTFTGSGTVTVVSDPITAGFASPAASCGSAGHPPCPELKRFR